ncbi:MAG: flagellum-specific ATP synthase FliI, partial [Deltaproteobacteria bacterium]|nr:flagellum-specific ATP synthase FliI [Deltaproteobacteria bacterium]
MNIDFEKYRRTIEDINPFNTYGKVSGVVGLLVEGHNPEASIGEMCRVYPEGNGRTISAEVVGFKKEKVLLMPFGGLD